MNKIERAIRHFITGTDTGVGKTVLSLLLMQFYNSVGHSPYYIKPVQTGCRDPFDRESDARFIYEHVSALNGRSPGDSVVYCFKNPKSPYFAARDDGEHVNIELITRFVDEKSLRYSPVVIEGAGGLFVPVQKDMLMIDMIAVLNARPVIAARAGLGTINHTLLSIEALNVRNIEPFGVVLIDSGEVATPPDMIKDNIEAIEAFSGTKVAGVIGRITNFSNPGIECYRTLRKLFGCPDN